MNWALDLVYPDKPHSHEDSRMSPDAEGCEYSLHEVFHVVHPALVQ